MEEGDKTYWRHHLGLIQADFDLRVSKQVKLLSAFKNKIA